MVVTGRPNRVSQYNQTLFRSSLWRYAQIEGFNDEQIAEYLSGYDVKQVFPNRAHVADLIRIPSVLRLVRGLLENGEKASFETRADLYRQASLDLIAKAGNRLGPSFDDRQTRRVEQILAAVAFEMMQRELYDYAARGADLVDQVEGGASRRCEHGISVCEWSRIRDISSLTNHCILEGTSQSMLSWQHRGMMEFYCGLHLARYSSDGCLRDAHRFAANPDWSWAWRFAIELPEPVVDPERRVAALGGLFARPSDSRRPTELIYRAWEVMEATETGRQVLREFQSEYSALLKAGNEFAEDLRDGFLPCPPNPDRDSLSFMMGSPDSDEDANADEQPQIERDVKPFAMLAAPVTRRQYWLFDPFHEGDPEFAEDLARYSPQPDCPVIYVSWYDAWCFARWYDARLPTETEWEYACRAGTTERYWWSDEMHEDRCTFSAHHTTPADSAHANHWGLMEMSGNVWEWCHTPYTPKRDEANRNLQSDHKVVRGGSFINIYAESLRSANRNSSVIKSRYSDIGFRICKTETKSTQN